MGADDPQVAPTGKMDFCLQWMFSAYKWQDPPPDRVKPVPIQLVRHITAIAARTPDEHNKAIADMISLAFFFFLLHLGEYTGSRSDTTPFRLCDVGLQIGAKRYDPFTTPIATLRNATFVTLEFTNQKNGVRGEVIRLGRSGDPQMCPVAAVVRWLPCSPSCPRRTSDDPAPSGVPPVTAYATSPPPTSPKH